MRTVLFVCTHNAGRSQMAEAFFNRAQPDGLRAESAGREPRPGGVWPNVLEAMQEVGIDLSAKRPQKLTVEMQLHADWGVTLACGGSCPYVPATVEDWDLPDPAGLTVAETRPIRDAIEHRVRELIDMRAELIRTDRTGHMVRLAALLPGLDTEFSASHSPEVIRACADAVLADYDEAPVRTHVLTLANKRTRDCLRQDSCALVPA